MVDYYADKAEAETLRADKAEERADKAEKLADKAEKEKLAYKRDSAIKMLKDGQSIEKVSEYLALPEKEIAEIREEIMHGMEE